MKIIVVGAGKTGLTLIRSLINEGHDVTVVDFNAKRLNEVCNTYDIMGVSANGMSFSSLNEAGLSEADVLITLTGSDEQNLLCSLFAKKVENCSTIARVRNPIYLSETDFLRDRIGLSRIINPELSAAAEIARLIKFPSAIDINVFAKGKLEMHTFKITSNSPLANKNPGFVRSRIEKDVIFCCVERKGQYHIPSGDFELMAGDKASVILNPQKSLAFFKKIGIDTQSAKAVMIVGGGTIAEYLAKRLLLNGIDVKIIELSKKRCEELSEKLKGALIINGDASNKELLLEEGLGTTDAFVALTGFDEENIILSLYAKETTNAKVITKVDRIGFNDLLLKLNMDSIIYPGDISAENILKYVRSKQNALGNNVENLYKMFEDNVEALEFTIGDNSKLIGIPLKDMKLKDNLIVCGIMHNNQVKFPTGDSVFSAGDSVVVVTSQKQLKDIGDILE